jgi:hypothetical protein
MLNRAEVITLSDSTWPNVMRAPYGAKGDGQISSAGSIIAGSNVLTDTRRPYTALDVGKTVYVVGAGVAGTVLQTTIASYRAQDMVLLSAAAPTTVASAEVVWGTNDYAAFTAAIAAATNGTVAVPPAAKTFYLIDNGVNDAPSNYFSFSGSQLTIRGAGRDSTVLRFGPEGLVTNTGQSNAFAIGGSQVLTFQDLTLQGPGNLGGGGPPSDIPRGWQAGQGGLGACGEMRSGNASDGVRFINCHVKHFVGQGVGHGFFEGFSSTFEGYGTNYASMGPFAGDDGGSGYSPTKHVILDRCIVKSFGDPAGGVYYHSMYVGTSHDIQINATEFRSPATGATGNMVQHYDSNVALANAGRHAEYVNCHFAPGTQSGVLTSYNCVTKLVGCTMSNLTNYGILIAGPVIIDGLDTTLNSNLPGITTTTQAQSTGLDWGLQLDNSRIEFLNGVAAVGVDVEHARSSATEFAIDGGTVFEGATGKAGIYICLGNVSARVEVGRVIFRGSPAQATRGQTGTLSLRGCRFETTGGQSLWATGEALALLTVTDCEFAGTDSFLISTAPREIISERNYGPGWTVSNSDANR